MTATIKLGVSRCLLGDPVRYDGGHKHDRFITNTLGQYVTFVPVCPEVECGLGVPRESMRLVGSPENPRLLTRNSQIDHTDRMVEWARRRVVELEGENLCGFIFKSDSPSSGMERVKVYSDKGMAQKKGVGIFAAMFMAHFPLLPVEEEGRLNDPKLREHFIERIFVFQRLRELMAGEKKTGALVEFHTRHKLLFMSHSPDHYRQMGKLVADASLSPAEKFDRYVTLLGEALCLKSTIKKNANVLLHILGYFKRDLSPDEKQEILEIIDRYRGGHLPIIVPITLLNHFVRKYDEPYLKRQYYLNPHPVELHLRNHV